MITIAGQTWWLTEDQRFRVRDGDSRARWLLVSQGSPIDSEVLDSYEELKAIEPDAMLFAPEIKTIDIAPAAKRKRGRPRKTV